MTRFVKLPHASTIHRETAHIVKILLNESLADTALEQPNCSGKVISTKAFRESVFVIFLVFLHVAFGCLFS